VPSGPRARSMAIAAGLAAVALGVAAWPFTVDDAFIVARYAANLAAGQGWAMNPGVPSDGVTALPWVLPPWTACVLGLDPVVVAKGLGLLGSAIATALVVGGAARLAPGGVAVTGIVAVASATTCIWAVAGLETGLASLLLVIAALGVLEGGKALAWRVGGSLGSLAWLRPECLPASLALLAVFALRDAPAARRAAWVFGALTVASFAARFVAFGDLLPLSFHAKPGELVAGTRYVGTGMFRCTGGIGALLVAYGAAKGDRVARPLGAVLLAHLVALVLAGGDWMPGHRLLAPVLPLYALALGAVAHLFRREGGGVLPRAGLVLALLVPLADLAVQLPRAREAGSLRETRGAPLAERLAREHRVVALVDVGFLAWRSGVEVVDLAGVTDPVVARAQGAYLDKHIDPGYLAARAPDGILLHASRAPEVDADGSLLRLAGYPVERRVAAMPWVRRTFAVAAVVPYAPGYVYVLLTRREEPIPRER